MRAGWREARKSKESKAYQVATRALGQRLLALRTNRQLTQEDAAALAGITWRHLQRLEIGESNVTLLTLVRIAKAYDVSIADLFAQPGSSRVR
jgi:XRE family transcriptional regulator, aerobic/anaerobic benzoate catabolism transcriptional regulator